MPVVGADGFKWLVDEHNVDGQLGPNNHEAELTPLLKGEGVFWDIGADVGRWAIRMSPHYDKVVAFEPHRGRYVRLIQNLSLNEIVKVETFPIAASDHDGMMAIGRIGCLGEGNENATLEPLDEIPLEPPTVVKIDVEGHEAHVLRGMSETADKYRPRFVIEMHHRLYGPEILSETQQWMDEHHYEFEQMAEINGQTYWEGLP